MGAAPVRQAVEQDLDRRLAVRPVELLAYLANVVGGRRGLAAAEPSLSATLPKASAALTMGRLRPTGRPSTLRRFEPIRAPSARPPARPATVAPAAIAGPFAVRAAVATDSPASLAFAAAPLPLADAAVFVAATAS